jgi:hypothetical protein
MGNAHLCNQLRMAIETFQNKYQSRLQESYKKIDGEPINFDNKINIK